MPPRKTALLVIDMQNFFSSMTTTALPNIQPLVKQFAEHSPPLPVIFTQHGHSQGELQDMSTRNQLIRKWGVDGSIHVGGAEWEIMDELKKFLPQSDTRNSDDKNVIFPVVIPKNTYDAFLPPDQLSPGHYSPTPPNQQLHYVLNAEKVERVVVCGVMTDCCADTTARGTFNRGFETWVASDACGSVDQKQHERALKCHEFGFGEILKTRDVLGRLREEGVL